MSAWARKGRVPAAMEEYRNVRDEALRHLQTKSHQQHDTGRDAGNDSLRDFVPRVLVHECSHAEGGRAQCHENKHRLVPGVQPESGTGTGTSTVIGHTAHMQTGTLPPRTRARTQAYLDVDCSFTNSDSAPTSLNMRVKRC